MADKPHIRDVGTSNTIEADNEDKNNIKPSLAVQCIDSPDTSNLCVKSSSSIISKSRENIERASIMRAKIEEKICEIEQKINIPDSDLYTDDLEDVPKSPDYNLITVRDSNRSRSCSVSERRQSTIDRLQSKLRKAEKELELKEEEVSRLSKIRDEVGSEIEDLTASLFEEANNMVRDAKIEQHKAEKRAKDANMKLSILEEEVKALKSMVQCAKMYSIGMDNKGSTNEKSTTGDREIYEVDPDFNNEFIAWRKNPSLNEDDIFIKRIFEEDINPCLNFRNSELSKDVIAAIKEDRIVIEKIQKAQNIPLPKYCTLLDAPRLCRYRMYLNSETFYNISILSRNRITAVCDLLCYLRYIEKGLITLRIHEVYLEVLKKRRRITSAKLGLVDDVVE